MCPPHAHSFLSSIVRTSPHHHHRDDCTLLARRRRTLRLCRRRLEVQIGLGLHQKSILQGEDRMYPASNSRRRVHSGYAMYIQELRSSWQVPQGRQTPCAWYHCRYRRRCCRRRTAPRSVPILLHQTQTQRQGRNRRRISRFLPPNRLRISRTITHKPIHPSFLSP